MATFLARTVKSGDLPANFLYLAYLSQWWQKTSVCDNVFDVKVMDDNDYVIIVVV